MYSVMWSEHCSYKSSKANLRQFGEKVTGMRCADNLMVGIGRMPVSRTSGMVAVTFKIESHNHPSYAEPYQGAGHGRGRIVRASSPWAPAPWP
ncbi:hypothetical protein QJS66_16965 [Kocuria rhizophila]|nr:hypothetical protein QJS66_16965 [Kocuria rhizophila]